MNVLITYCLVIFMGFYPVLISAQPTTEKLNNGLKEAVIGLEELDLETGDLLFFQNKVYISRNRNVQRPEKSLAYHIDIFRVLHMLLIRWDEDQIPVFFEYMFLMSTH